MNKMPPAGPFGKNNNRTAIAKALRAAPPKAPVQETPSIAGTANVKVRPRGPL
jgi:hypothetical protein